MAVEEGYWRMHIEGGGLDTSDTTKDEIVNGMETWDKQFLLTLTRGTGANQAVITWMFSYVNGYGLSGTGTVTIPGLTASTPPVFWHRRRFAFLRATTHLG